MAHNSSRNTLIFGTLKVGYLTLISRALGFIRDLCIARYIGAGALSDVFFVAFRLPNLLRAFLAEGALTSSFLPIFAGLAGANKKEANDFANQVLQLLLLSTTVITLFVWLFSTDVAEVVAPGYAGDERQLSLCASLIRLLFPYIIFVSAVSIVSGIAGVFGVFGLNSLAQITVNIFFILGAVGAGFVEGEEKVYVLASLVLLGGLCQMWILIPFVKRTGLRVYLATRYNVGRIFKVLRLMFFAIFGALAYQLTILVSTMFATMLEEGSVSWLFYADRIIQLPIGVISIALGTVLLPVLSNETAVNNEKGFVASFIGSLRFSVVLFALISGIYFICGKELMIVLFARGEFSEQSAIRSAEALRAYAWGLTFFAMQSTYTRAFAARGNTKIPAIVGIVSLVTYAFSASFLVNIEEVGGLLGTFYYLTRSVGEFVGISFDLGHVGLAYATSISQLISVILLHVLFMRRFDCVRSSDFALFYRAVWQSAVGCMLACVVTNYLIQGYQSELLGLITMSILFSLIYCISLIFLRSEDIKILFRGLKRIIMNR